MCYLLMELCKMISQRKNFMMAIVWLPDAQSAFMWRSFLLEVVNNALE